MVVKGQVMKSYDSVDIFKFILSIMVIAIHTVLLPMVLYPWLRVAVPCFFLMSSFFFYKKVKTNQAEGNLHIKKYVVRNLKLYLFWFIVLLPMTISIRINWFDQGFFIGILNIIKNTLFSSTFVASWFIVASITAMVIVFFASKKLNNITLLILSIMIYILISLSSAYSFLIKNTFLETFFEYYTLIFTDINLSFPDAFIYIVLGKIIAENDIEIKKIILIVWLILSAVLLYVEWRIVYKHTNKNYLDAFLSLPSISVALFLLVKDFNFKIKGAPIYRKCSTIIYASHGSIIPLVRDVLKLLKIYYNPFVLFLITLCLCLILCHIIFMLQRNKKLKFLKYAS